MARPPKQGLLYFPLDVDFFEDMKIFELTDKWGMIGECVYFRLLTMIYRNGYYLESSVENVAGKIYKSLPRKTKDWCREDISKQLVVQVVQAMAEINLIDKKLLTADVITSVGIQRRYQDVAKRRLIHNKKYWLLTDGTDEESPPDAEQTATSDMPKKSNNVEKTGVNVTKTLVNVAETGVNVTEMLQRKENKTKVNKSNNNTNSPYVPSRQNERELGTVIPTLLEVQMNCADCGYTHTDPQEFWDFYQSKGWKVGNTPMWDWVASLRQWERRKVQQAQDKMTTLEKVNFM
ncbi:MAG: DUF4373 domain-containing protein [Clostridiales bacterium]|jgi:hypothetical protein|nr:DUF4373 domain-containing protein [Clostridiales bacterium]